MKNRIGITIPTPDNFKWIKHSIVIRFDVFKFIKIKKDDSAWTIPRGNINTTPSIGFKKEIETSTKQIILKRSKYFIIYSFRTFNKNWKFNSNKKAMRSL